jgi:hypothetical protein
MDQGVDFIPIKIDSYHSIAPALRTGSEPGMDVVIELLYQGPREKAMLARGAVPTTLNA